MTTVKDARTANAPGEMMLALTPDEALLLTLILVVSIDIDPRIGDLLLKIRIALPRDGEAA